jgi:hypothetical protein
MGRRWGRDFDENQVRHLIRTMTKRTRFYRVLKEELVAIGRWKNMPRGRSMPRSLQRGGS